MPRAAECTGPEVTVDAPGRADPRGSSGPGGTGGVWRVARGGARAPHQRRAALGVQREGQLAGPRRRPTAEEPGLILQGTVA